MSSALIAHSRKKVIFLVMLLLSSGLTLPASAAFQRYESLHDVTQIFLPQQGGPQSAGGFFFRVVQDGKSISSNPSSESSNGIPTQVPQALPQITPLISGGGGDDIFVRQGNTYVIFPQTVLENGRPFSAIPFAPSLLVWLDSEKRRSRFRIYVEILDALERGPMTPYEVSFHLRLNSKRTREFIEFLIKKGFLESVVQEGRTVCVITATGKSFVENMRTILNSE